MPTFDLDAYFAKRAELNAATQQKMGAIQAKTDEIKQEAASVPASDTWVNKLGLEPGSVMGNAVNIAASVASGAARTFGQTISLPDNLISAYQTNAGSPEEQAAYNRLMAGKATPADQILLQRQLNPNDPNSGTVADRFDTGTATRNRMRDLNRSMDLSNLVDQTNRQALSKDIRDGFAPAWEKATSGNLKDTVQGVGGLVATAARAIGSNPQAVGEYVFENAPQLMLGMVPGAGGTLMAASNLGYAADTYQQGIENYAKENGGKLPSPERRRDMMLKAASLAAAEEAGDVMGLGFAKAAKGLGKAGEDALRTGFKQSLKNTGKAAMEGFASEAPTEGYQQWMEGDITGKPATAADIYEAAVIGGASGAGLTGGLHSLAQAAGATPEQLAQKLKESQSQADVAAAKQQAISSGDVSAFLDPNAKTYAPAKAVEALLGNALQEGASPEQVQAKHAEATKIVTDLQQKRDVLADMINRTTTQGQADLQAQLDQQRQLAATSPDPKTRSMAQELAAMLEQDLAKAAPDPKVVEQSVAQLKALDAHLEASRHALDAFSAEQAKSVDVGSDLQAVTDQTEAAPDATQRLLRLAMVSPQSLTAEQASTLASAPNLSEDQRAFLRSFSQARIEENRLKDAGGVSAEIYDGSKPGAKRDYVGIAQYRQRLAQAIASDNQEQAQRQLAGLSAFAQDHENKAAAAEQGLQRGLGTQIVKNAATRTWEVAPKGTYTDAQIQANGGHTLNKPAMVQAFRSEANALRAAQAEMRAAMALHFGTGGPQNTNNKGEQRVQDVPDAPRELPARGTEPAPAARTAPAAQVQDRPDAGRPVDQGTGQAVTSPAAEAKPASPATQAQPEEAGVAAPAEAVTATPAEATTGKLAVFEQASPEGTPFLERKNLIADFFRQIVHRTDAKTQRPLASVKDFLSQWTAGKLDVARFIPKNAEGFLYPQQQKALEDLRSRLTSWVPKIQANLRIDSKTAAEFRMQDMMQYLVSEVDGKPMVEENVATAIAYSAYDWLLEAARAQSQMTDEQINAMFGRDKDAFIDPENRRFLQSLQAHEFNVVNDLGRLALQSLGLKAKNEAPQDLLPRLQVALGTHAMARLEQEGVLERVRKSPQEINRMLTGVQDPEASPHPITMVRVKRSGAEHRIDPAVKSVLADVQRANGGSMDVVSKLFGVEKSPRFATTEPVKFLQKFAKGTQQKISKLQRKVIEATMAIPHVAIPEMLAIHAGLGEQAFLAIAGVKPLDAVHDVNLAGVEAQNQNLQTQHDLMWEMLDSPANPEGYETKFYVQQSVGRNFRGFFTTQSLNQQTSKIHRYMFARPDWTSTIDPQDPEQVRKFELALATNFGLKVENQPLEATLAAWQDKLAKQPEIMETVRALAAKEELDHGWSEAERAAVVKIATRHEGMMTLQALVAMVKFEQAKQAGKAAEVTMLVGADGKTNGPMLTHLALGAATDADALFKVLNQGGMYSTDEGQPTSYGDYYARPQSLDLYEGLGSKILDAAAMRMQPLSEIIKLHRAKMHKEAFGLFTPEAWAHFEALVGTLRDASTGAVTKEGRNLTKTPLTAFGFGSSLTNSVKGMQDAFIEGVYSTMEAVAQGNHKKLDRAAFLQAINGLIAFGDHGVSGLAVSSDQQLLRTTLQPNQETALRTAFQRVIGNAVTDAMHEHFNTFIARRGDLNKTIQGSFAAYRNVYAAVRSAAIEKMMDDSLLAQGAGIAYRTDKNGKKVPLHDLSAAQEAELRAGIAKLLPVMHTAYSLHENNLEAGLYMAKEDKGKSDDALYQAKVALATPIANSQNREFNYLTGSARMEQEVSPGVAGTAYAIHSSDSAIIHAAIAQVVQSMNVHDEISNGVTRVADAALAINGATASTFLDYSPAREAANMLERVVVETAAKVQEGTVTPDTVVQLFNDWADILNWGLPPDAHIMPEEAGKTMLATTFENARRADTVRLGAIAKMAVMDQYPWHGGTFTVTDELRKAAEAKLKEIPEGPSPLLDAAVRALEEIYAKAAEAAQPVANPVFAMDPQTGTAPVQEYADTAWGPVGKNRATVASDMGLVRWFEGNPKATVRDVIALLQGRLQEKTLENGLYKTLLDQLAKSAPLDLPVHYVTPATDPAIAVGGMEPGARGWHTSGVGVFVLGQQFAYSGLTAELLMHEMVHATLVDAVEKPASPAAHELVDNLKALQQQAIEHAKEQGVYEQHQHQLDNLHEFIAYGMTDTQFQQTLLQPLQVSGKPFKGNALVDGMKAFLRAITGLFFGSAKEAQTSALGMLMHNVSGLLAQTARQQSQATGSRQAMAAQIASYSTQDIYTALEQQHNAVSPTFSGKLKGLLSGIVEALHGPLGTFSQALMTSPVLAPVDVWAQAKITGEAPFASLAIASGLPISEQEAFVAEQIEATVRAALNGSETQTKMAYRELQKLYNEAEQKLRGTSHAFLFEIPQNGNRSDYLARFAALGLAHEGFNTALQFATAERVEKQPKTVGDRLQAWVERALGWFQEKVLKTYGGQQADAKLEMLVRHLTGLEAQKRHTLLRQQFAFIEPIEQGVQKITDAARSGATKVLNSGVVRNNVNPFIRAAGTIGRTAVNGQTKYFMSVVQKLRNEAMDRKNGFLMSMITEFVGAEESLQKVLRETKNIEGERKDLITHAGAAVLDAFANGGKALTDGQRSSLGEVFLQTGAHHLLGNTSMAELEQLLADPRALQAKIAAVEAQLAGSPKLQNYVKAHADALAYFKVTGVTTVDVLRTNAHQIARLSGTAYTGRVTEQQAEHNTPVIAQLVALYAFSHLASTQRTEARAVLTEENARTDGGHGVQFLLQLHQHMEQESLERLFNGNPALMLHGYTPEIYNPYTELEVGDESPRFDSTGAVLPSSAQELRDRGYSQVAELAPDPKDPNQQPRWLYLLKDGGLTPRITGAFSFTGMRAKGALQHNGTLNVNTPTGLANAATQASITGQALAADQALFNQTGRRNLSQVTGSKLAPLFNEQGDIVNWRYMMNKRTRQLLDADTRADRLLGVLAGSVYDKEASREQNRQVVELLRQIYRDPQEGFAARSADFLKIGPDATDPQMREIWRLLPDATKKDVRAVWGADALYVKKDAVDILFGYRKYSLADMFDKDPAARNVAEQMAIHFAETFFGRQARTKVRTFERVWQELVKEAKDLIVIKTGTVMLGNIISNTWLLWQYGVPVKDMLHHQYVALKGATAWQEDSNRLRRLQLQRDSGYLSGTALDEANREIVKLEDSLDRNPIKELVDAGLMPTIVEDLGAQEDPYSYKSMARKKLEGVTDALPDWMKTAGKQVYMSHDTAGYQMLSRITQLSDFVARYALYHHLIERQANPLTKEEAIQKSSDAFINYDVPMHRDFQYLEDMGFLMFNKYFLRIQRVLGQLFKDRPGRMLATMAIKHFIGTGSTVLDSSVWHRIGNNPVMAGALQYPKSLDELLTVHAAMKLMP